jgi:RHS repeat-associated protein
MGSRARARRPGTAVAQQPVAGRAFCKRTPAAQPTGSLPAIPTTTFEYNRLLQPTRSVDAAGTASRTTTKVYDAAGRLSTEVTTATSGTDLPTVSHGYSSTTGRETSIGAGTKTMKRVYDSIGRQTSHTDAAGVTTTTTYDLLNRPLTIDDGKAKQTLGYNPTRDLLTSVNDPQVGLLGTNYDADGAVSTKTYPNGLTARTTTDEAGARTTLRYYKPAPCAANCEWMLSQAAANIHGQQTWQTTTTQAGHMSTDDYIYDEAGRIKQADDRSGLTAPCSVHTYNYDKNGNRTRQDTFGPGTAGACNTTGPSTSETSTYDEADRLTNTGFQYDAFGRTLTVPAASAGGGQLTSTYFSNDLARSLSQDATTRTYTLDPAGRISARDTTTGSTTTTESYHYVDTIDNGLDSPSWIAQNASGTAYIRMIAGPDGDLAAIRDGTGIRLQLTNLHDDVVAEASTNPTDAQLTVVGDTAPFGMPRQQSGRSLGWLGGKRRSTELRSGVIAMGRRTYLPQTGRFLQVDPVRGGSANSYDYALQDPLNITDLTGENVFGEALNVARKVARKAQRKVIWPIGRRVATGVYAVTGAVKKAYKLGCPAIGLAGGAGYKSGGGSWSKSAKVAAQQTANCYSFSLVPAP